MIRFDINYPRELTNKAWQKAKSLKDKLQKATKTGLGELLDNAQAKWESVNWNSLEVSWAMRKVDQSAKFRSIKEIQIAKAVGEAELKGPVKLARQALLAASKKADSLAKEGKLSKDATAKARELAKKLLEQEALLRDLTLDDFDEKAVRFQQLYDMQIKKLKGDVQNLEEGLKKVVKSPTKKTWEDEAKQQCRSVGNTLGNYDEFKAHWKVWQKFDGLQVERHPELKKDARTTPEREKEVILDIVKEMLPHLNKLKQDLK